MSENEKSDDGSIGLRNMVKKNFQGYDLDKCIESHPGKKMIFVPERYGSNARRRYNYGSCPPNRHCAHCNLGPCVTIEFDLEVEDAIITPEVLSKKTDHAELLLIIHRSYRKSLMAQCGKQFMTMLMPHDNKLPKCAMDKSLFIAARVALNGR